MIFKTDIVKRAGFAMVKAAQILILVLFTLLVGGGVPVMALPDLTSEVPQAVPINYNERFFVYFRYGNPASSQEINNLVVQLQLEGQGFQVLPDQLYDLYTPLEEGQNIPQIPLCSNEYDGFDYQINPRLWQNQELIYGPQTAKSIFEATGREDGATLPPRAAGCLRVGVKLASDAQVGDSARLVFNPDLTGVAKDFSPGEQAISLFVGPELECSDSEEAVRGTCQPRCTEGQVRGQAGVCLSEGELCGSGKEMFEGRCVPACLQGQQRNDKGNCVTIVTDLFLFFNQIWTVPLVLVVIILGWLGFKYFYKRIRYLRRR